MAPVAGTELTHSGPSCGMDAWTEWCTHDQTLVLGRIFHCCRKHKLKRRATLCILLQGQRNADFVTLTPVFWSLAFSLLDGHPIFEDHVARAKGWYIQWDITIPQAEISLPSYLLRIFYGKPFWFKVNNISVVRAQRVDIIISGLGRSIKPPNVSVTLDPSLFYTLISYHSLRNGDSISRLYPKLPILVWRGGARLNSNIKTSSLIGQARVMQDRNNS